MGSHSLWFVEWPMTTDVLELSTCFDICWHGPTIAGHWPLDGHPALADCFAWQVAIWCCCCNTCASHNNWLTADQRVLSTAYGSKQSRDYYGGQTAAVVCRTESNRQFGHNFGQPFGNYMQIGSTTLQPIDAFIWVHCPLYCLMQ